MLLRSCLPSAAPTLAVYWQCSTELGECAAGRGPLLQLGGMLGLDPTLLTHVAYTGYLHTGGTAHIRTSSHLTLPIVLTTVEVCAALTPATLGRHRTQTN